MKEENNLFSIVSCIKMYVLLSMLKHYIKIPLCLAVQLTVGFGNVHSESLQLSEDSVCPIKTEYY